MMTTVLIVDDDKDTCTALGRMVEGTGVEAVCVGSGQDALEFLDTGSADLAIVDWMMAGMDGIDLITRLRARADTRELPVVLFTAALNLSVKERALAAGATDYWVKSKIDLREIEARIAQWLPAHHEKPAPFDRPLS